MKKSRGLPAPFLILILAGMVLLLSTFTKRSSGAGAVRDDTIQVQTVEQERMAAAYFRILSWLSGLMPSASEPVKANPQPAPQIIKTPPRRQERPGRMELCTLPSHQNLAADKSRACDLN